jgi:phosphoribosyl 1,2-cyclic phosphodiesterase/CheY-like chemotaxis protein
MKTVLIIDDDPVVGLILNRTLVRDGWRVIEAKDGEAGLKLAQEHHPDLVICDLLMPRTNGFAVCRALRQDGAFPAKIIATSTSAYESDHNSVLACGADAFAMKPVEPKLFLKIVRRVMTASGPIAKKSPGRRRHAGKPAATLLTNDGTTTIRFWGVRGSIPTPGPETAHYGGNTACVEVRADGELIVLDAGTGIRNLGLSLQQEAAGRPVRATLLITHTHWDHIQGFPFFIPAYHSQNEVRVFGYEEARSGLEAVFRSQMENPYFPVSLSQMPSHIQIREQREMMFDIGPVKVRAAFANHPGICVGYRLESRAGTVVFIPDHEPFSRFKLHSMGATTPAPERVHDFVRQHDQKMVEFIRGADVLIMDAQYDTPEYRHHVGWGHSCVEDTVATALAAGVRRLYLFHHDPGHNDRKIHAMVAEAKRLVKSAGATLVVEGAREGAACVLKGAKGTPAPRRSKRPFRRGPAPSPSRA